MIVPEPKLILVDTPLKSESPKPLGDLRQVRVDEYFRSMELSANSIRAYRRALTRFTKWTDGRHEPLNSIQGTRPHKTWHLLKHQDLDRYKAYLFIN